jgi:hypothetical protein
MSDRWSVDKIKKDCCRFCDTEILIWDYELDNECHECFWGKNDVVIDFSWVDSWEVLEYL